MNTISPAELSKHIEALLFWKGEPMSAEELAKDLSVEVPRIESALIELRSNLVGRGLSLMENAGEFSLGTSPESSALIERLTKEELSKDLGKASLEALAIILYKGPVKRAEIDHIRGVNSTFIIRNLLVRGLIQKRSAPNDQRTSIYSPSFELLSYLGISRVEDMPDFEKVKEELRAFQEAHESPDVQSDAASAVQEAPQHEEI